MAIVVVKSFVIQINGQVYGSINTHLNSKAGLGSCVYGSAYGMFPDNFPFFPD